MAAIATTARKKRIMWAVFFNVSVVGSVEYIFASAGHRRTATSVRSAQACVAECAILARGAVKAVGLFPFHMGVLFYHHLAYPLAIVDSEVVFPEIYKDHPYLATVVGIYRPRGIRYRYSLIQGKTRPRAYLAFISLRKLDIESCGDKRPVAGLERHRTFGKICAHIHPRRLECAVLRERMMASVDYLDFDSVHLFIHLVINRRCAASGHVFLTDVGA